MILPAILPFQPILDTPISGGYHGNSQRAYFFELVEIASRLELLDFFIVDFYDTAHNTVEFFISMERVPRNLNRQEILAIQLTGLDRARKYLASIIESSSKMGNNRP